MNESLWMYFFMMMGIFGIVMINVFGQVLLSNEQNYYLLKESTEAAMYDAIDLNAYRGDGEWEIGEEGNSCIPKVPGTIKIIREKFVESFARRFANSANLDRQYRVIFNDIDECPPKVSVSLIASERFSMLEIFNVTYNADTNIINSLTGIIEADKKTVDLTKITANVDGCVGEKTETVSFSGWSACNYSTNTQSRYKTTQYRVGSVLCGTTKEIEEKECFTNTETVTENRRCTKVYTEYTPVVTYGNYGSCNSLTGMKQRQIVTEYLDGPVRCRRDVEIETVPCSVTGYIIPDEVNVCEHPEMFPQSCRDEVVSGWTKCENYSQSQTWKTVCMARGQVCSETPYQIQQWCYSPPPSQDPQPQYNPTKSSDPSKPTKSSDPQPSTSKPTSGGGRDGDGCFLAGTKVVTLKGYTDIDKIKVGDIVLSYNEETKSNEYQIVTKLFVHNPNEIDDNLITISFDDNTTLKVTSAHRFYIKRDENNSWIPAEELKVGDQVMYSNHDYHTITDISTTELEDTVYNISVANNHNYFVGDQQILVHNIKVDGTCIHMSSSGCP
jgi:hypothetical protein